MVHDVYTWEVDVRNGLSPVTLVAMLTMLGGQASPAGAQEGSEAPGPLEISSLQATALPDADGLEAIDLSNPDSVHGLRASWPHRVEVWSMMGSYVLDHAARALDAALSDAGSNAAPSYLADLELLRAMVDLEQRAFPDARKRLEASGKHYAKAKDTVGTGMVQGYLGALETARNHPDQAEAHLNEALETLAGTDAKALHAWFQIARADVHLRRDQLVEIVDEYQAAIDAAKAAGDAFVQGYGMKHLGIAHLARNEPELAAAKVEGAIMVHHGAKQPMLEASAHRLRAICHLLRGDFNNARLEARKGVRLEPPMSGRFPPSHTSEGFFWRVYQWKGEFLKSLEYMDRALNRAEAGGDRLLQAHLQWQRGVAWSELGQVRKAMEAFDAADAGYREMGDRLGWLRNAAPRLYTVYQLGDLERLETLSQAVAEDPWTAEQPRRAAGLFRNVARIWQKIGDTDKALAWLDRAVSAAEATGDALLVADLNEQAGEVLQEAGRDEDALARYEKAWPVVRDMEDPQWIPYLAGKLEPLYKEADRKKDAKKVAKVAKKYQGRVWTPLLRPPTMPLASGTEMIRWLLVMQRFGDTGSLGRASQYRVTYNVSKQYRSYNDYLGDFEEIVAAFKATGNVVGIMQPTDTLVRVLIATDGWEEAKQLREDQITMAHDKGFFALETVYLKHAVDEYYQHEDTETAMRLARRGVDLAREAGNRWNELDMLLDLGDMQAEQGQAEEALKTGKEALAIAESLHDTYRTFYALGVLTAAARAANDAASADQYRTKAMGLVDALHLNDKDVEKQLNVANVYKLLGAYDQAIASFEKAIDALPKEAKKTKENLEEEIKKIEALRDGK